MIITQFVSSPSPAFILLYSYPQPNLPTNNISKHLRRQPTQQPRLIRLRHLLKYRIHALPLGIPHSPQPIPRNRTRHHTREIRYNEPHSASTQPTHYTPELARRVRVLVRHALVPQHLLENAAELLFAELGVRFLRRASGCAAEAECAPGEAACEAAATSGVGDFIVEFRVRGGGAAGEAVVCAGGVVVAAARGVAEGVVCVVDLLEALCACGAFGGARGDAVGVVFQCCSCLRGLVSGCGGRVGTEGGTSYRHRESVVARP